jgi:3-hydroxyacyl-[acyl-carrier-protein] dehydratase
MPPALLVNLDAIDLSHVVFDAAAIEKINPHRYEMRQLDAVVWHDPATGSVVGYKDVTDREFWVRGHIPGRPLMPGVIMVEAAAQLASFYVRYLNLQKGDRFIGFGGIEDVKFRGTVVPGNRLYLLGTLLENRPRRFICAAQGVVDKQMVFQARIIGMPV